MSGKGGNGTLLARIRPFLFEGHTNAFLSSDLSRENEGKSTRGKDEQRYKKEMRLH